MPSSNPIRSTETLSNVHVVRSILTSFRKLHRTRKLIFNNDAFALEAARQKINSEFRNHMHEENEEKIKQMLKIAEDAEVILRTRVIQAEETEPGTFKVNIKTDTFKDTNYPYNPDAEFPIFKQNRKCKDR